MEKRGRQTTEIAEVFREVCQSEPELDGLRFDADSLKAQVIKEDAGYEGVRATFLVDLEKSRFAM